MLSIAYYFNFPLTQLGIIISYGTIFRMLQLWLEHNNKFENFYSKDAVQDYTEHNLGAELLTSLFVQAEHEHPSDEKIHVALGILFSITRRYEDAVHQFVAALKLSAPQDRSVIWNKIGATLANGGASKEAIDAYHQAVALRPIYPRALANLAIAYANLNQLPNALRYYLSAISTNPDAEGVWESIRSTLLQMQRYELLHACDTKRLDAFPVELKDSIYSTSIGLIPATDRSLATRDNDLCAALQLWQLSGERNVESSADER